MDCTTIPPGPGVDTFTPVTPVTPPPSLPSLPAGSFPTSAEPLPPSAGPLANGAIQHVHVKQGDFVGFQAGPMAGRYAHSMKAGEAGLEYLMGGERREVDVCCYPT